ncbi:HEPN domain-containing protein [Streptomyces sp. NPDC058874]|uniref:HEPN domain-containing protein n=1 Tax=unclassified Streptomyces TaxID=2593676 RepID=UPI0036C169EB
MVLAKNPQAAWSMADNGWRTELQSRFQALQIERNTTLNTPKTWNISKLFADAIGIEDVDKHWYWKGVSVEGAAAKLGALVTLRGGIAHRGSSASCVTKGQVEQYYAHVKRLVACAEAQVTAELLAVTGSLLWVEVEAD